MQLIPNLEHPVCADPSEGLLTRKGRDEIEANILGRHPVIIVCFMSGGLKDLIW